MRHEWSTHSAVSDSWSANIQYSDRRNYSARSRGCAGCAERRQARSDRHALSALRGRQRAGDAGRFRFVPGHDAPARYQSVRHLRLLRRVAADSRWRSASSVASTRSCVSIPHAGGAPALARFGANCILLPFVRQQRAVAARRRRVCADRFRRAAGGDRRRLDHAAVVAADDLDQLCQRVRVCRGTFRHFGADQRRPALVRDRVDPGGSGADRTQHARRIPGALRRCCGICAGPHVSGCAGSCRCARATST